MVYHHPDETRKTETSRLMSAVRVSALEVFALDRIFYKSLTKHQSVLSTRVYKLSALEQFHNIFMSLLKLLS